MPGSATLNSGGSRRGVFGLVCRGRRLRRGRLLHRRLRHRQAFVVDETNGSWGDAIEVPGSGNPQQRRLPRGQSSRVPRPATAPPAAPTPTAPTIPGVRGRRDERQLGHRDRSAGTATLNSAASRGALRLVRHGRRLRRRRPLHRRPDTNQGFVADGTNGAGQRDRVILPSRALPKLAAKTLPAAKKAHHWRPTRGLGKLKITFQRRKRGAS